MQRLFLDGKPVDLPQTILDCDEELTAAMKKDMTPAQVGAALCGGCGGGAVVKVWETELSAEMKKHMPPRARGCLTQTQTQTQEM